MVSHVSGAVLDFDATSLLGRILVLAICAISLVSIYNIYFHPLAKYPGPKLAAVTRLPWIRALFTGNIGNYTHELHRRYGKVVRIAPNELSYITEEAWKDIYTHRQGHMLLPKYEALYHAPPGGVHGILTAPHAEHQGIRRLLSHAFSDKALREQEELMTVYVDLLISRLHGVCNDGEKSVDMVSWYNWTTFDLVGDLAFGEPFGCLEDAAYHSWVTTVFESTKVHAMVYAANMYPSILPLLQKLVPRSVVEAMDNHMDLTKQKVDRRLSKNTERKDFITYILRSDEEGELNAAEIRANSFHLMIAGSETTATLLSGVTFHLLRTPDALRRLEKEVRETFKSESEISIASVSGLKYMLAVLDEGMRLYPPIPAGLTRRVPEPGETINGAFVPGGTIVSVCPWAAFRSSQNFESAESFVPERFLGDTAYESDKKRVFLPFSTGPRVCLGRSLAYAEMRLILARIIWNFDMKLMDSSKDWDKQKMYILWEKGPLRVALSPVNRGR